MVTVIALDPGETTGFALVSHYNGDVMVHNYGTIPVLRPGIEGLVEGTDQWLSRFVDINDGHLELAFEGPLLAYSARTKIELHEVRSVIRAFALRHSIPHADYAPATVKATVTGSPSAGKRQVALAVQRMLKLPRITTDHITDALAVGVTHLVKKYNVTFEGIQARDIGADAIIEDRRRQSNRRSSRGGNGPAASTKGNRTR